MVCLDMYMWSSAIQRSNGCRGHGVPFSIPVAPGVIDHGVRVAIPRRPAPSIILGSPRNTANPISAPPRKNLKVPPRPSGFSRGVVYADMDAVAHDGTVDMGFRGAPVVLDGPVILDLRVLRFSLSPPRAALRPLPARESKTKTASDLRCVILASMSLLSMLS